MVDTWPATLPQCLLRVYSSAMGDGRLRSQMGAGPDKVRRRSSAMPRPLKGSMLVTSAQLAMLQTFVDNALMSGSLPFNFPDPITQATILVRFADALPSWSKNGTMFDVALDLEVLP